MTDRPEADSMYERFQLIANGPALFNAVVTGLELDIFHFLSQNPQATFGDILRSAGIQPHKLRVLMLALCSTGLVDKHDDRYSNSDFADENLVPHDNSWRDILVGWQRIYYPAFTHMTTALREGTNAAALDAFAGTEPTLYQRLAHDPESEAVMHRSMGAFTLLTLPALLDNAALSSVRHLLDVGGGDGTTAKGLAERYPEMQVTILDMPSVTELARETVPPGSPAKVRLHPGDILKDPFPRDADAILFSHILEVFSPDLIFELLAKAVDALPSSGKVFIYGFNASDDEIGGVLASRLSLYLNVLATGHGMAYPAKDYEDWLRRAGCTDVKTFRNLPYEHGLTIGIKA